MTTEDFGAVLRGHAAARPERRALTVLRDGEAEETVLTFRSLDRAARAMGARLQSAAAPGARVLLLSAGGPDFVVALLGCVYAGMVAVPLPPPAAAAGRRRFDAVVADARPALVLLSGETAGTLRAGPSRGELLEAWPWIVTDDGADGAADDWRDPGVRGADGVLQQYTSGSTGVPRGVRISHANLRANLDALRGAIEVTGESVVVSWLPLHHDMGLVAKLLHALDVGAHFVLMPPAAFLRRPARWLGAITRYRATLSGAPDFAWALSARRITEPERQTLDLRSWRVALTGAEPVRATTLDAFVAAFGPCGFRRESFYPAYGLAEATVIVSGGRVADLPVVRWFTASALESGTVQEAPAGAPDSRALVGCGRPLPGQSVEIVDPETAKPLGEAQLGEVWIAGPSVGAPASDDRPDPSFGARLAGRAQPYLRTGDLAFLLDDELFIVGRLKDLLIVRGRNLAPHDIEASVEACDPRIRAGAVVAFPIDVADAETVAVACEVDGPRVGDAQALIATISGAVAAEHGVEVGLVALLRRRTVPRTTSGKLQRRLCRALLLDGRLEPLALWRAPEPSAPSGDAGGPATLEAWLADELRRRAGVPIADVDPERPLAGYGLGSIALAELVVAAEDRFKVEIPWPRVLDAATLAGLAAAVRAGEGPTAAPATRASADRLIPARDNAVVQAAVRLGVRRLFRRHIHAVWLQRGYVPAAAATSTVYFLNHTSWWDFCIPLLLADRLFRQRARFMMTHGVMAHRWYFRMMFQRIGVFSIRLDDPVLRHASLRYAFEFLQGHGRAFYIYPQGETTPDWEEIRFQDGLGWLSARCPRVDFVPVACHLHTLRTARPQLFLKVGEAVTIDPEASIPERTRVLEARCRELVHGLRAVATDPYRPDPDKGFERLR